MHGNVIRKHHTPHTYSYIYIYAAHAHLKRAGALKVRVGGMTIMFARDAGKRSAQAAPTRGSPAAVPPRAPQSARPARTARPEEPEAEAPSTSPNSRHRWSAKRLLVFQARKRREEARGLSLTRILCRPAMQRLRESCFGALCPNSTPPAAVDPELGVATCAAEEPRQLSDSLADAVHTPALKRRLSFYLSSTCGQDMQGGRAQARLRLDSTSRLCRASSTGIALSGRCPSGDNPPYEPSAQGIKRKINPRPSGRKGTKAEPVEPNIWDGDC